MDLSFQRDRGLAQQPDLMVKAVVATLAEPQTKIKSKLVMLQKESL